jgi:hypothetical protein
MIGWIRRHLDPKAIAPALLFLAALYRLAFPTDPPDDGSPPP